MYASNNRSLDHMKQKLKESQGGIGHNWRLQHALSEMDRFNKQKISNDIAKVSSIINQVAIIDIYLLLHVTITDCTLCPVHM